MKPLLDVSNFYISSSSLSCTQKISVMNLNHKTEVCEPFSCIFIQKVILVILLMVCYMGFASHIDNYQKTVLMIVNVIFDDVIANQ